MLQAPILQVVGVLKDGLGWAVYLEPSDCDVSDLKAWSLGDGVGFGSGCEGQRRKERRDDRGLRGRIGFKDATEAMVHLIVLDQVKNHQAGLWQTTEKQSVRVVYTRLIYVRPFTVAPVPQLLHTQATAGPIARRESRKTVGEFTKPLVPLTE
jgi:hypothetical protein